MMDYIEGKYDGPLKANMMDEKTYHYLCRGIIAPHNTLISLVCALVFWSLL